jgi:uncharacterized membrane protein
VLLIGIALVSVFWMIEARRYRYADIWYARGADRGELLRAHPAP